LGIGDFTDIITAFAVASAFSIFALLVTTGYLLVEVGKVFRWVFALLAVAVLVPSFQVYACIIGVALFGALLLRSSKFLKSPTGT
jgi:hypothetical protein